MLGDGYWVRMTVLVILLVLALIFGVGAVVEGVLWVLLISAVLVALAAWWGWTKLRGVADRH